MRGVWAAALWTASSLHAGEPLPRTEGDWVSITDRVAGVLGLTLERTGEGLVLSNATHQLRLYAGRRSSLLDGVTVWLHDAPRDAATNELRDVTRADFEALLEPVMLSTSVPPAHLRIVLDAGHGGGDTGARAANGVLEKDLCLEIARLTAECLRQARQEVWLTRTNDTYLTLGDRTRLASNFAAQVFVSIHANSSPSNPLAAGIETYVLPVAGYAGTAEHSLASVEAFSGNRFDPVNALLGFNVQRRCAPQSSMDRGLKRARWFVLRDAPCPAVLVECGFLSSHGDVTQFGQEKYRARLAQALADGILDFGRFSGRETNALLAKHTPAAAEPVTTASAAPAVVSP